MDGNEFCRIESDAISDFARVMHVSDSSSPESHCANVSRVDLDPENVKNGLAQLVLTLIKLLHELLERQAIRRMESGSLNEQQIERLGLTLMKQAEELERLRNEFGLKNEDLNLDLGPIGKLF
jgi:hypothetical protein